MPLDKLALANRLDPLLLAAELLFAKRVLGERVSILIVPQAAIPAATAVFRVLGSLLK